MICGGCSTCAQRDSCFRVSRRGSLFEAGAKFAGATVFFLGSLLFASTTWAGSAPWVFGLFLIGHACWFAAGLAMKDRGTVVMNAIYVAFDISAILIRL